MKSNLYKALLLAFFAILCLAGVASTNDIELEIVSEEEPQGEEDYHQTADSRRERPKTGNIESQGPDLDTLIEQFGTYTDGNSG